jgi:hypothetical protein
VLTPSDLPRGGARGLRAIPDPPRRAGEASLKVPQGDTDVGSVDRRVEMPRGDPPRHRQGDHRRCLATCADPSRDRGPPRGRPGGPRPAAERATRLIHGDERRRLPPGVCSGSAAHPVRAGPGSLPHRALWRARQGAGGSHPKPGAERPGNRDGTRRRRGAGSDPESGAGSGARSRIRPSGARAEAPPDALPWRGRPSGRSSRPGSAAAGVPPRGRMSAPRLGPLRDGAETDAPSSGARGGSPAAGSEPSSALQPTSFDRVLSRFARAPHDRPGCQDPSGR